MEQNGYYAGLVRSQLAQDEIETKEELEIREKKSSLKRRNTDEEVQFEKKDDELYIEEETVKVNICRTRTLLYSCYRSYRSMWSRSFSTS